MVDDELARRIATDAAAGALAGIPGGVTGAIFGALGPVAAETVAHVGLAAWTRLREHTESAAAESFDDVARRLIGLEGGPELLLRAIEAARWTTLDAKLRALGRCLAAADDATIDTEALLVTAAALVDAPHLRVLAVLAGTHVHPANSEERDYWTSQAISAADPRIDGPVAIALCGVLGAAGLAAPVPVLDGESAWRVTALGQLLLERASDAATS